MTRTNILQPWRGVCAALCLFAAQTAWAAGYTYTEIHVEGGLSTQATGINEAGAVVGSYQQPLGTDSVVLRPFRYQDGMYRVTSSIEPAAHSHDDINDRGHVVSNVAHRDLTHEAFLVRGKQQIPLAVPDAVVTLAYGLSDRDMVSGSYDHSPNELGILTTSAYLWSQTGGYTLFDAPSAAGLTIAWGVNKSGTAVGVYMDAAYVYHGFVRPANGNIVTLDYPGSPYTQLTGINDRGDIVGFYQDPSDWQLKGFVYKDGQFIPITPPNAALGTAPCRITNDGRVVGWYVNGDDLVRSFMATPVAAR